MQGKENFVKGNELLLHLKQDLIAPGSFAASYSCLDVSAS